MTGQKQRVEIMSDRKTALLPSSPVSLLSPLPGCEGQIEKKREKLHRHLRLTGSNRPWEGWGGWCGFLSMLSQEECRQTQWALPSADAVCTSCPRPFSIQSSEQLDQFSEE